MKKLPVQISCKGRLIDLSSPCVMGVINTTPDSYYAPSRHSADKNLLKVVGDMLEQGATFIDMGGYSTRPYAKDIVSVDEEIKRVIPAIAIVAKHFPEALISVDTFRSEVAKCALEEGACMINDISAGVLDEEMLKTVAHAQVPVVIMHMRGTAHTHLEKQYTNYNDMIKSIASYFSERIHKAYEFGVHDIIIDPGFGFSKTLAQNYELMDDLSNLQKLVQKPMLIGISRKTMIYKFLEITPEEALNSTSAMHMVALCKGAKILRVHDVAPAMEVIKLYKQMKNPQ